MPFGGARMKLPKGWKPLALSAFLEQPESGVSVLCEDSEPRSDEPGVLKLSCVTGGRFNPHDRKKPMAKEVSRLTTFAKRNTILISRSNTPALVGASAYVKNDAPFAFLPDTLWMLHPQERSIADISMKWLSFLLLSDAHRLALQRIASGTSDSMKKIQKGALLKLKVPVPPLPEQRKIADILCTWDEALEKLDTLIAAKERRKKGLMQRLLTGKRRMKGFAQKWVTAKLGELFAERVEQNRSDLPLLSITADRGVVVRGDLTKRDTSSEDKSKYLRIAPGDIGYNTMRMWQGVSALSSLEGIISPAYTVCISSERIKGRFAAHFFKLPHTIHLFHRYSQGLVDDTLNLKYPNFATIEVRVPSDIKEQRAIADILDACDDELRLLRDQRAAIDRQKRGLMQRLLTGRVRVSIEERKLHA